MSKPFQPAADTVNLAVTSSTGRVAFLSSARTGGQVRLHNAGPALVFVNFGTSSVTATTAAGFPLPVGAIEVFTVGIDATNVAALTASAGLTATLYATAGNGE